MTIEQTSQARPPKAEREDVMAAKAAATRLGARVRGLSSSARQFAMPLIAKELGPELVAQITTSHAGE